MFMVRRDPCAARAGARLRSKMAMAAAGALFSAHAAAETPDIDIRGSVGVEYARAPGFVGDAGDGTRFENPGQARENLALKFQFEANHDLSEHVSAGARFFLREDTADDQRDEMRFDELWLQYAGEQWDLRVGNQLVTWGSIESVSPIDIVNPRDYVEDIVEPVKMGIPAARWRWRFEEGDFSAYLFPRYEPSRYVPPSSYYSFSGGLPNRYPEKRWHGDEFALRYFHPGDGMDIAVSYFSGYERNTSFDPAPDGLAFEGHTFRARRLGVEATKIVGDLVLKGEFVGRTSDEPGNRRALLYVLGAEYTLSSIWKHSDLTLFVEYLAASRNVHREELFQNDLFAAARWAINDQRTQRLQAGFFLDLDNPSGHVYRVEYSISPFPNAEIMARYTDTRDYYPGPRHVERDDGVFYLLTRYNF